MVRQGDERAFLDLYREHRTALFRFAWRLTGSAEAAEDVVQECFLALLKGAGDLGKVAPYIAENHFTFPVIPAKDVVDAVVPSLAIPRNWLVDAKGKLEWEQIGFGAGPQWQSLMLAKLDEVIRGGK